MNLSSLVHTGKSQVGQSYPSQAARSRQSMASSLMIKPFEAQEDSSRKNFSCVTTPQPPPSPPADESPKCSLPSISSLFGLADTSTFQEQSLYSQKHASKSGSYELGHQPYNHSSTVNFRGVLPPTPPLHSDSSFGGRQSSPSGFSNSGRSISSAPTYFFTPNSPPTSVSEITVTDSYSQRQHLPSPSFEGRVALPSQIRGYGSNGSQDLISSQNSAHSFYSHVQKSPPLPHSGLYGQRPLPQQFPPPIIPLSVPLNPQSTANPWQHHHYISPSSAASFPQSQDRYICQTCNKAFSRPSSLRIHSHSHTGEKPFKCPHQGCGKAFSVRSNMKRHERGCHSFEGSATETA